jgi:hypothetical protein
MVENVSKPAEACRFQRQPKNFGGRSLSLSIAAFSPFLFYGLILSVLFGRGFDLSDESFYILQMHWWDSFLGGLSLFGAYLSRPYALLGEDILQIRFFGAFILWIAGYAFGISLYKVFFRDSEINRNRGYAPVVIAFMTFTFYWTFGIFTPNYNLLVLTALLVTTSQVLIGQGSGWRWFNYLIYALILGALVFIKVSSAIAAILLHLTFICLQKEGVRYALFIIGVSLFGILLNYYGVFSLGLEFLPRVDPG